MFQREAMQIGAINCFVTKGFPTHAKSVQSFISNLFAFIETHHYELLLSMLKKVYGRSLNDRVQQLNRTKNLPVVQ